VKTNRCIQIKQCFAVCVNILSCQKGFPTIVYSVFLDSAIFLYLAIRKCNRQSKAYNTMCVLGFQFDKWKVGVGFTYQHFITSYSNRTRGGWSSEGIIQDDDPTQPVICNSTHLTSFSVLVSASSEAPEVLKHN